MLKKYLLLFFFLFLVSFNNAQDKNPRIIRVFVALCDNESQGIVPVPERIGNGNDPENNLYWGCGYGVRTFFKKDSDWKFLVSQKNPAPFILERCVFKHKRSGTLLIAEGYRGDQIKKCIQDFVDASAGLENDTLKFTGNDSVKYKIGLSGSTLLSYVGHDGLMEFSLDKMPEKKGTLKREVIILACISKSYFRPYIEKAGANPLIWTTGLMSPEAYSLEAAVEGWIANENAQQIRKRTAEAYHKYQNCGLKAALGLFASGF